MVGALVFVATLDPIFTTIAFVLVSACVHILYPLQSDTDDPISEYQSIRKEISADDPDAPKE